MKTYEVVIQTSAEAEINEAFLWFYERVPDKAVEWYKNLEFSIYSLETLPHRCGLAPENEAFKEEIRQLLFRKHKTIFRILFTIHGETVHVLHVRHGSQNTLGEND